MAKAAKDFPKGVSEQDQKDVLLALVAQWIDQGFSKPMVDPSPWATKPTYYPTMELRFFNCDPTDVPFAVSARRLQQKWISKDGADWWRDIIEVQSGEAV